MSKLLRPVLAELPSYVPGRTVPGSIKLASNESGYPMLPVVADQLHEVLLAANRYPDTNSVELTELIASRFGLDPAQVAVGNGSVAVCTQIITATVDAGDDVMFAWRSFEAYPIITALAGGNAIRVPLDSRATHDLDAMLAAITPRTKAIFVCNPNNPTGTVVHEAELTRFLDAVPANVLVVLDEAYIEFVNDPTVPDGTRYLDRPNVVVLRTFSKAYGLAGLRIGYALTGDPAVATGVRQAQVPFAVTSVSQRAAIASLSPAAEKQLLERVQVSIGERARVGDGLRTMGYSVPVSEANFVWLELPGANVAWAAACEERKVIVRPYGDEGVRVTIGTPEENDLLLDAARALA
jgi:histidinol-phosphate aminotransferase